MTIQVAEASAPGSSANLGPGFDCLAVAWQIYCRVRAEPGTEWEVKHLSRFAPAPGEYDAVLAAAQEMVGMDRPLRLEVENQIPLGKGLGSSAAARTAAAVAAARSVGEEPDRRLVFERVAEWEKHPDNAAASVYGGLSLATADGEEEQLEWHPGWKAVVIEPPQALSTTHTRKAVQSQQQLGVVTRSLARMGALVAGLQSGSENLLRRALGDEIHELPRSGHHPEVARVMLVAYEEGIPFVAWSGAGPSVVGVLAADHRTEIAEQLSRRLGEEYRIHQPEVDEHGFR